MSAPNRTASPVTHAAVYLRVSIVRQADNDLSIPTSAGRLRTLKARSWQLVADFVEPGQSATDDRRPPRRLRQGHYVLARAASIATTLAQPRPAGRDRL